MSDADSSSSKPFIPGLRALVKVRASELPVLAVSMLWIFLALTAYYVVKPLRSTVLQTLIGVDNKSYALLATTLFVGVFVVLYGRIAATVPRRMLVIGTFVTFAACLVAFALALPAGKEVKGGSPVAGYVFYVWVSTFNLMVVSQFWSVAAEVWSKEQGLRLFGAIGVGGVLGSIFGTAFVSKQAKHLPTYQLLLGCAILMGICLALSLFVLRHLSRTAAKTPPVSSGETKNSKNAAALVLASPYLRLVAVMMLLLNLVNSNNEWIMDAMLAREKLDTPALNEFYGNFYLWQNVLTLGIQLFITAKVQEHFGARGALMVEPVVGIVGGFAFLAAPRLEVIRAEKIAENGADYSIQSNTRELLYVPTSPEEKYAAKAFNDTFVVRLGDAVAAASIWIAAHVLLPKFGDLGLKALVGLDVVIGVVWFVLVLRIGAMHKAAMKPKEDERPATAAP